MKALFLFLLSYCTIWATDDLKTKATNREVTVYLNGAQVTAEAILSVPKGTSTVRITDVSPFINQNSIQISGLKEVSILSIGYETSFLPKKTVSDKITDLENKIAAKNREIALLTNTIKGLQEEESLLSTNKLLSSDQQAVALEKVTAFSKYYRERVPVIKMEIYDSEIKINILRTELDLLHEELKKNFDGSKVEKGEIVLKLDAAVASNLNLTIKYNVSNAGWFPTYEIKAQNTKESLNFIYKAHVYQQTGDNWNDVKLTLSTGDPTFANDRQELEPHYLNFNMPIVSNSVNKRYNYSYNPSVKTVSGVVTENGSPLPGVTVVIKGTTIGTQTDFDGRYTLQNIGSGKALEFSYIGLKAETLPIYSTTMNLNMEESADMLQEVVVVSGYSSRSSKREKEVVLTVEDGITQTATGDEKAQNLNTVVFKIAKNYSIPSLNDVSIIEIDRFEIPATFEYYAAPILNENVYLTAKIKNWEQYDLLAGEANIYAEGSYAGKTFIDPFQTKEELVISLGADPNIIVERKQTNNLKYKSLLGATRIITKNYEITIRNNKPMAVDLQVFDRIPISQNKEIKVEDVKYSEGIFDKEKSIISWKLKVEPKQVVKKQVSYVVKYPKEKRINL
ncbi:mucoidy inhibitor MuiA family protein [Flavobacterium sp.]|jgi:hypothetical protein|uniref:mucoidy inhibitor MuiA family protein n=1 Tax=Flavobacterium sp. TaxID=239 RepID=UPI0037BF9A4D